MRLTLWLTASVLDCRGEAIRINSYVRTFRDRRAVVIYIDPEGEYVRVQLPDILGAGTTTTTCYFPWDLTVESAP